MTDGRQTKSDDAEPLHLASRHLKESGVQVYSLGIGQDYDIGELLDIASDDASVFRSSDVDELISIVASITEQTCKGKSKTPLIPGTLSAKFHSLLAELFFETNPYISTCKKSLQYISFCFAKIFDNFIIF